MDNGSQHRTCRILVASRSSVGVLCGLTGLEGSADVMVDKCVERDRNAAGLSNQRQIGKRGSCNEGGKASAWC